MTKQKQPKLLPCPFCGKFPKLFYQDVWKIHCSDSRINGCILGDSTDFSYSTKNGTIEAWNTRAKVKK